MLLMRTWGQPALAKDTPGFIVNRVARPFYGEAIRLLEEGVADVATIDWAMTELGGFRMGPFALMDLIGNDINYAVTESVWTAFHYDDRYKPSFAQKRNVDAGWLGRKSGRGWHDHSDGAVPKQPRMDKGLGQDILWRILVMLINEAADAVFWGWPVQRMWTARCAARSITRKAFWLGQKKSDWTAALLNWTDCATRMVNRGTGAVRCFVSARRKAGLLQLIGKQCRRHRARPECLTPSRPRRR